MHLSLWNKTIELSLGREGDYDNDQSDYIDSFEYTKCLILKCQNISVAPLPAINTSISLSTKKVGVGIFLFVVNPLLPPTHS